jgi:iron complex transport system permease protein
MVGADVGARLGMSVLTGADVQIPVGIVTGLVGGPYFLYLMRRQDEMGEI